MKGPWRVLSVQGSLHILHFLWHHPNENSYWLYFCILCNKNGIKGLWGHKGPPSLGPGPALVLQWNLPWSYNIPNMDLYILAIFLHSIQQNAAKRSRQHARIQRRLSSNERTHTWGNAPTMLPNEETHIFS